LFLEISVERMMLFSSGPPGNLRNMPFIVNIEKGLHSQRFVRIAQEMG
jgi:hypothetical protein